MTYEEFEAIMDEDSLVSIPPFNVRTGLNLIAKYLPTVDIEAAEHDVIYACGVEKLIEAGITKEDAEKLRNLNWMIDEDSLACYV